VKSWVLRQDRDFCQQELTDSSRDTANGQRFCTGFHLLLHVKKSVTGTGEEHFVIISKKVREFLEQLIVVIFIFKKSFPFKSRFRVHIRQLLDYTSRPIIRSIVSQPSLLCFFTIPSSHTQQVFHMTVFVRLLTKILSYFLFNKRIT
jgi:hypothetical protein